jgi:hypothetical protein
MRIKIEPWTSPSEQMDVAIRANGRRHQSKDEAHAEATYLVAFQASPVGLQRPQLRAYFREEEAMGLDPASSAFAALVGNVLLWHVPLAAYLDCREVGKSRPARLGLGGCSVKLLFQRGTPSAGSQEGP